MPEQTTPDQAAEYVLGADDDELARLALQHRLWAGTTAEHWDSAGFRPGQTLLDLGCGPGFATRDLAQLAGPRGRVIAADRSRTFLDFVDSYPKPPASAPIDTVQTEAQDLDLPEASIDGAYSRWMFTFIEDPTPVIAAVARALRPGASVCLMDYTHWQGLFWAPTNESLPAVRRAITSRYAEVRARPDIGQELPRRLEEAGLEITRLDPLFRFVRPTDPLWLWPTTYFENFLPKLVELGHMTEVELARWRTEWAALTSTPGAYFQTPPQALITARNPG